MNDAVYITPQFTMSWSPSDGMHVHAKAGTFREAFTAIEQLLEGVRGGPYAPPVVPVAEPAVISTVEMFRVFMEDIYRHLHSIPVHNALGVDITPDFLISSVRQVARTWREDLKAAQDEIARLRERVADLTDGIEGVTPVPEHNGPATGFFLCSECGVDLATRDHKEKCRNAERYPVVASETQRRMVLRQYGGTHTEQSQIYADHIYLLVAAGQAEWELEVVPDGVEQAGQIRVTIAGVLVGFFDDQGVFDTRASHLVFPFGVHTHISELAARLYPSRTFWHATNATKNVEEPVLNFTGDEPKATEPEGVVGGPVIDFKERVATLRERYIAATPHRGESKTKSLERATRALGSTRGLNSAHSQRRWLDNAEKLVATAEADDDERPL